MLNRALRTLLFFLLTMALLAACRRAPSSPAPISPTAPLPSPTASDVIPPTLTLPAVDTPTRPSPATPVPSPTSTLVPTPIHQGGHIVEVGLEEISTLNPLLAADDDDLSRAVGSLLFEGLLRVNSQTAALSPGLARDWQVSDDGRTFTFRLRRGVAWHDGQPFSAADVVFTLTVAGDPEGPSPYRFDLAHLIEVTAPDGETVLLTFDEPGCDALYAVGRVPILPRHLLEGQDLTEAAFNQRPVGSGQFVFDAWQAGEHLVLQANESYWAGRPYTDSWTYRVVSDTAALQDGLGLGKAHLARLPASPGMATLPEGVRVLSYPADRWYFLALNNNHPILGDATVRQALALALDRERLLAVSLNGQGSLIEAPWLATHWALDGASLTPLAYAPDLARQLLAEAGWRDTDGDGLLEKDGALLQVNVSANQENPVREQIAILAQQYWHAVGISVQVETLPWGIFLDDLFSHAFDTAVFDWPLEPALDQTWLWSAAESTPGVGFNFVSYANPQADALLERGRVAPGCDPARRAAAYRGLARQLVADQPYIFLFTPHHHLVVSEALIGPQPGPYGGLYWNAAGWYLAESEKR